MKCVVKSMVKGFPVDTLLCFVPKDGALLHKAAWKSQGKIMDMIQRLKKEQEFLAESGEIAIYRDVIGVMDGVKRVVFYGLGEVKKDGMAMAMAKALGQLAAQLPKQRITQLGIFVDGYQWADVAEAMERIVDHGHLGAYRYMTYRTKNLEQLRTVDTLALVTEDKEVTTALKKVVARGNTLSEYVTVARDLANEIPHVANPAHMEEQARALAKRLKLKVTVFDTATLKKKGMNLIHSVGRAAVEGPRLVMLSYRGNPKSKDVYALVGKGVTYDTGGLSMKPSAYMRTMKVDMAGSATVFGTIGAVASLGLKVNVDVYMPFAENAVGPDSYKPDDVLVAYNGMTVEIENTDAEGRLLLADALTYACEQKPKQIVDLATLTGAALMVTGGMAAPVMGNDDAIVEELRAAGVATNDRVWPLPLWEEANSYLKSSIADVMNCYGGGGSHPGTVSAAAFLRYFVDKDIPWAHIDIAGVTLAKDAVNCYVDGPSGFGVRLLTKWLEGKQA